MRYQVGVSSEWGYSEVYPDLETTIKSFPWAADALRAGQPASKHEGASPGSGGWWQVTSIRPLADDEPGEFYRPAPRGACRSYDRGGVVPPGQSSL